MKIISVRHPSALWISYGWMTILPRKHARYYNLVGERVGIHASRLFEKMDFRRAYPYLTKEQMGKTVAELSTAINEDRVSTRGAIRRDPRFGAVLCTVMVKDYRALTEKDNRQALRECGSYERYWGLFLGDVQVLTEPLKWRGSPFMANVPDELIKERIRG